MDIKNNEKEIKYYVYTRKSSESEDRQILSIPSQIDACKELARKNGYRIVKVFKESQSAKTPGRKGFNEMLEGLYANKAGGVISWKLNRLARNPIDGGQIQWMSQNGVIKHIATPERDFKTGDNTLMMAIEFGMANQFILDLSKDTKRGLERKLKEGHFPGLAPLGYMNDKINHTVIEDPDRYELVRRMWDMMLTGSYTPSKILDIANNQWGLRTKIYKRIGGKELSQSSVYRIFNSIYYAGIMRRKDGKEYETKHKPMVTLKEFERVQQILNNNRKPRAHTHQFAFTGLIECGECGYQVTAERKRKFIKSENKYKHYEYYRCTKRSKRVECKQKPIKAYVLDKQITKILNKYTIIPEFRDWALEVLNEKNDAEIEQRQKIYTNQHKTLAKLQTQLDNLTKMRYRDLISDKEYLKEKMELQNKIRKLKYNLSNTEERAKNWLELTENVFDFACNARQRFVKGNMETKKNMLRTLGQKFVLLNGKLHIEISELLEPIGKAYPSLEKQYKRLELMKNLSKEQKTEKLASVYNNWGG